LAKVIRQAKDYGWVVVVDDGSDDKSFARAKAENVTVLRHLVNRGQGAALQTGHDYAFLNGADIVIDFDSDGQHMAEEIPTLVKPIIEEGYEAVLGSRFLAGRFSKVPFLKKWFILKPAIMLQNFILGTKLSDAHNGFRSLSRTALSKIKVQQDGMAHASEIIEQINTNNLKYKEVPVTIIYNDFGQGFISGLKILRDLLFQKLNK